MDASIIVALITGACTVVGVIISNIAANHKIMNTITVNQAVTDTKLQNLTDEVRQHNNFAQKIPVIEEQIKVANHRIDDLERKVEKHEQQGLQHT